jgi:DNA-binding NtrC family response regulator
MCELRGRILVVDDDFRDLAYYSEILRGVGFDVSLCSSYQEGARRVGPDAFDFIIVSQGSPAFEGKAVLERAVEIDRHIPVLVLTRCLNMNCYLDAMQLGAVDYLEKPIPPEQIAWVLETHLRPCQRASLKLQSES